MSAQRQRTVRGPRQRDPTTRSGGISLLMIPLYFGLLASLRVPMYWVFYCMGISGFTFCLYAWDKSAARRGAWRTPESTLHLWSLMGGWPGALLAQQWLRHKSVKAGFRGVFWATVAVNVAALVWLASSGGLPL